jgi:hypothetical protein
VILRSALVAAALLAAAFPGAITPAVPAIRVVASGLDNPRGVAVTAGGVVYVAEAGRAGKCRPNVGCFGFTSAVTRIRNGVQKRVATGIFSIGDKEGNAAIGADGIAIGPGGKPYVIVTGLNEDDPAKLVGAHGAAQVGKVLRVPDLTAVADIGLVERTSNPAGGPVDEDPYGLTFDGSTIVAVDAAGNDILTADHGDVTAIGVFPSRVFGKRRVDSVPTCVTVGPDGAYYVGEYGGDGTPVNRARVWRVVPGKKPTVYATGFNSITGIGFGPGGAMYVGELFRHGPRQFSAHHDSTGAVIKVTRSGRRTELGDGKLLAVGGLAVAKDGSLYVSTNSVLPRVGKLVRIAG